MPTDQDAPPVSQTFFAADGVRYRVTAFPDWNVQVRACCARYLRNQSHLVQRVKEALYAGGFAQSATDGGIRSWSDIELIYAGMVMDNDQELARYHVPPVRTALSTHRSTLVLHVTPTQGCQCLIAVDGARLRSKMPPPDSAYWN